MIELIQLERKMISAKYDGKKFKYWYYKRKVDKLKKKQQRDFTKKNK